MKRLKLNRSFSRKQAAHGLFFALSAFVFLSICYIGIKNVFRYNSFKQEFTCLETDYTNECRLNQQYKLTLASMQDPNYWELQAKEKLGMVKDGEEVYRILSSPK